jgi:3-oxoacyl-[acyl-carrier-protein] synthase III
LEWRERRQPFADPGFAGRERKAVMGVRIGLAATASYLPETWMSAAEIGSASGIPEQVILEKFGLRGKHIAARDEHVSDMSVAAASALLDEHAIDPAEIDVVLYYGSLWKDYPVWQAAPWIAHRLGCEHAYGLEYANVSCGTPVALRLARNFLLAEPDLRNVLIVAASRESHLLDYSNGRSRFMFNFGDGAVAGLLTRDGGHEVLGCHALTDGSFSLQVKVPAGGSVEPASAETVAGRRHFLDVADPAEMKGGLDEVSLPNFVAAARGAVERSGAKLEDVSYLCGIHMKRSMHDAIVGGLGDPRAAYLDDTGHMSGVDSLLALDRASRAGELSEGDLALLLAAGTGYTWAASVIRW